MKRVAKVVGWVRGAKRSLCFAKTPVTQHRAVWKNVGLRAVLSELRSFRTSLTQPTVRALFALFIALAANPASAVQPGEMLPDAKLEARARELSAGLRCLVCQNQSIDDSDAPLAKDLRVLVRERLKAGESDAQVTAYVVERYGEYVLLKPPFAWHTWLLWLLPALVLAGGVWVAMRVLRGRGDVPSAPGAGALSGEEEAKLKRILGEKP